MTAALEDIKTLDLEEWLTLNTAASPTKLKQGQSPNMNNVWVDEKPGSVITAPGLVKVGTLPSNLPGTFCINYFKTSSGTQTFVVSDNRSVWTTLDFQNFTLIITGLSASFQLRGKVIRDKLWLTNGFDSVRTFDGTTVVVLDGTSSTPTVPKGRFIDYHDERVWLYHIPNNRSQTAFSALTDSSGTIIAPDNASAWPSSNTLQISEGDADFGTGLLLYRGYLHFFKQYSIWRLVGYDEYTYTRVKSRSSTGTRFNESIQILDSLVHFIGIDGIYIFDGEESERISDIIDPATASQTAFGFNQLQQPNTNNQFLEVAATADWNAGTSMRTVAIDNGLSLAAADDSKADFDAGTLTNVTSSALPGALKLSRKTSGTDSTGEDIALNEGVQSKFSPGSGSLIGSATNLTDGAGGTVFGASNIGVGGAAFGILIDLKRTDYLSRIVLARLGGSGNANVSAYLNTGAAVEDISDINLASPSGFSLVGSTGTLALSSTPQDKTILFSAVSASQILLLVFLGNNQQFYFGSLNAYPTAYQTSGEFVSRTLDFGSVPDTFGYFNAIEEEEVAGNSSISYYTQSSSDGVSWDASVAVTNGGAVGSTLKRYLRWGALFSAPSVSSSGTSILYAVYLIGIYTSAVFNTGGNIFAWGPFQADYFSAGQTILFYYRTGTTAAGCLAAAWNLIVPGGVISDATTRQFVQFKIDILGGYSSQIPTVSSVTINWVAGTGVDPTTLQNVCSAYWRNRYWLSAAGPSATSNDTILVRGKKTFGNPWMLKDWSILSFTRYQDAFYGCSSVDGSIYKLDTGFSKAGEALDSYFETGDFVFGGFTANLVEMLVEAERSGPWNLTISVSLDRGRTWTDYTMDLTTSTYDESYISRINLNASGDRVRFRFRTNGIDTPFQVHRAIVFYKLEAARGSVVGDYVAA